MVNCGKPSQGCHACRARRIKCSATKPECTQCQKSRRPCPGYRDAFESILRDETLSTQRKAMRGKSHRKSKSTVIANSVHKALSAAHERSKSVAVPTLKTWPSDSSSTSLIATELIPWRSERDDDYYEEAIPGRVIPNNGTINFGTDPSFLVGGGFQLFDYSASDLSWPLDMQDHLSMQRVMDWQASTPNFALSVSVQEQALLYFLSSFVIIPKPGTIRGYLDFLVPMLQSDYYDDSTLFLCVAAVSMAAFSTRPSSRFVRPYAARQYSCALQRLNSDLRNIVEALKDETLASVILMGLFETITSTLSRPSGWNLHMQGALALVKMRGCLHEGGTETIIASTLHNTIRNQYIVHCLAASMRPDMGADWWNALGKQDDVAARCAYLKLLAAELRAESDVAMAPALRTPETVEAVLAILKRAEDLDVAFMNWAMNAPDDWHFSPALWISDISEELLDTTMAFMGRLDAYTDICVAGLWNLFRAARLLILSIQLRCTAWLCGPADYKLTPTYARVARACKSTIEDIIASVPQILKTDRTDSSGAFCGSVGPGEGAAGVFMLWPLFAAASSDFATDLQRKWLVGRLSYMGTVIGIGSARILCKIDVRIPSMFIARDSALMAHALPTMAMPPSMIFPSFKLESDSPAIGSYVSTQEMMPRSFGDTECDLDLVAGRMLAQDSSGEQFWESPIYLVDPW